MAEVAAKKRLEFLAHRIYKDCKKFNPNYDGDDELNKAICKHLLPNVKESLTLIREIISNHYFKDPRISWPFSDYVAKDEIEQLKVGDDDISSMENLCRLGLRCLAFTWHPSLTHNPASLTTIRKQDSISDNILALEAYNDDVKLNYKETFKEAEIFFKCSREAATRRDNWAAIEFKAEQFTIPIFKYFENAWHFVATGIILSEQGDCYLITARHFFNECPKDTWFSTRYATEETNKGCIRNDCGYFCANDVLIHPDEHLVSISNNNGELFFAPDLAAVPRKNIKISPISNRSITPFNNDEDCLDVEDCLLKDPDDFAEYSIASRVALIGYPEVFSEATDWPTYYCPLARTGFTAVHPARKYRGEEEGVVNFEAYEKDIGAPILIYNDRSPNRIKLLGIYSRSFGQAFPGGPSMAIYTKANQIKDIATTWVKLPNVLPLPLPTLL